ncbi:unnamed protein product [Adineta steineri]|uniref:Uncharacterized protein n=1 Tax=Adineta steineri TaxID=433720 RepID=A0A813SMF3_9BILA|nr:unnamed protein product [Adineta steineri]CAF1173968.1 unnamed protein product [Adineta steineri]
MIKQKSTSSMSSVINKEKSKRSSKSSKGTNKHQHTNIPVAENVRLVWLDQNIDENQNDFCRSAITEFRHVINSIKTFTEYDECLNFLKKIENEKVCVIVSGPLCQRLVPEIHDRLHIDSIYIYCDDRKPYKKWAQNWKKIKGIFSNTVPICEYLKQSVQKCEHNAISMNYMPTNNTKVSENTMEQMIYSFICPQVLKEILSTIQFDEQHFTKFIKYCEEIYHENEQELNNIKRFKQTYREKTPIWWYTDNCFLKSMVNRALKTMDMKLIIKMDFFISDIHRQIEQLYVEQFRNHSGELMKVYRGQGVCKTDFEQIKNTQNGFISFNNFLFATKDSNIALNFARHVVETPDQIGILFAITFDPLKLTTPFALINKIGQDEQPANEYLFSMSSVFRVRDIKPIGETNRLWQVHLTMSPTDNQQLHTLIEPIYEETCPKSIGWGRFSMFSIGMNQLEKAQQVYKGMLEQTSDDYAKSGIYHQLGWIKDYQGKYEDAILYYKKTLEISQKMNPADHLDLAMSYNNIGLAYYNMGNYPEALSAHEKALEIRQKTLSPNHPDLAMSNNNIGMAYINMQKYSNATPFCKRAIEIAKRSLSPTNPYLKQYQSNFDLIKMKS